jgi:hypothetical protein
MRSTPQGGQGLVDPVDRQDSHAVDTLLGLVGGRDQHRRESQLRRLAYALLAALNRSDFPCQSNFTKYKTFRRQWPVFKR